MKHLISIFTQTLFVPFLLMCTFLFVCNAHAQQICFNYRGEWSPWRTNFIIVPLNIDDEYCLYGYGYKSFRYTDGSGFELQNDGGRVFFSFRINNYVPPTKAQVKAHKKTNEWFEYTGYVEYYVDDQFSTAEVLAKAEGLVVPNAREDVTPKVKRRAYATIKIAPYEKNPYCYNLWFDNIGIGFSAYGMQYGDYKLK